MPASLGSSLFENPEGLPDPANDDALERVMTKVPRGALALSGLSVALLLIAWFAMYALVFLPRGTVG